MYEMQQYIFNEITKDDVIENEIDEALLEQSEDYDCHLSPEDGCDNPIHNI